MTIRAYAMSVLTSDTDVVAVPLFAGCKLPKGVVAPVGFDLSYLAARGFDGKAGEGCAMPGTNGTTVFGIGLGDPAKLTLDGLRRAAGTIVKSNWKVRDISILVGDLKVNDASTADAANALVEGAVLAAYTYEEYRNKSKASALTDLTLVGSDETQLGAGIDQAEITTSAVYLARDLINGIPDDVTPSYLAKVAHEISRDNKLLIEVWDENKLKAERMGGILGVAAGSDEPPRYIQMTYKPKGRSKAKIALVGKGITFDSGGLSLKPAGGMMTMKCDMSGAAAVLGVMSVIADLAPSVEVIGICCATENLPGPKAIMPGDVLRARNGKTIEVLNTDAEGRLVLADGLSRAVELGADAIIDLATLTGACIVALGREIAGIMSNDDALRTRIETSAEIAAEQFWHLPLPDIYRKHIDSSIADMKNIGAAGEAGTLSAGLFLQEFVGDTPWAHLDIAGPAFTDHDDNYIPRGGTGFAIRTLIEFLQSY